MKKILLLFLMAIGIGLALPQDSLAAQCAGNTAPTSSWDPCYTIEDCQWVATSKLCTMDMSDLGGGDCSGNSQFQTLNVGLNDSCSSQSSRRSCDNEYGVTQYKWSPWLEYGYYVYTNSCDSSQTWCNNAAWIDPGTEYICYYIDYVTSWSACNSSGLQYATAVHWATKSGTSCLNAPLVRGCPVNGTCGSATGGTYSSEPSYSLRCSTGIPSAVGSNDTNWWWACYGLNGGSTAPSCVANKPSPAPSCGSAHGGTFTSTPTSGLCSSGVATGMNSNDYNYWWNCVNVDGDSVSCLANKRVDGSCGWKTGYVYGIDPGTDSNGTNGLCNSVYGSSSRSSYSTYWKWYCYGVNGGSYASCNADKPVCGSSDGGSFSSQPTSGFCSQGNVSGVSSSSTGWYWYCWDDIWGSYDFCSASQSASADLGACGTQNGKVYQATDTGWDSSLTFCDSAGGSNPAIIGFPGEGQTTYWNCLGTNGGSDSPPCYSSRLESSCVPDGNYSGYSCSGLNSKEEACSGKCGETVNASGNCTANDSCGVLVSRSAAECTSNGATCTVTYECDPCEEGESTTPEWVEVSP